MYSREKPAKVGTIELKLSDNAFREDLLLIRNLFLALRFDIAL